MPMLKVNQSALQTDLRPKGWRQRGQGPEELSTAPAEAGAPAAAPERPHCPRCVGPVTRPTQPCGIPRKAAAPRASAAPPGGRNSVLSSLNQHTLHEEEFSVGTKCDRVAKVT